jgi:hypothetical protein
VHIPTTDIEKVTENRHPTAQAQGVSFLRTEPSREPKKSFKYAVFKVGSGVYEFQAPFESTNL